MAVLELVFHAEEDGAPVARKELHLIELTGAIDNPSGCGVVFIRQTVPRHS